MSKAPTQEPAPNAQSCYSCVSCCPVSKLGLFCSSPWHVPPHWVPFFLTPEGLCSATLGGIYEEESVFPVAQMVKSLPAMQETWVQSLGWEDPLENGTAATPVFLPRESHGRGAWQAVIRGVAKSWTRLSNSHFHMERRGKQKDSFSFFFFLFFLSSFFDCPISTFL